MLPQCIQKVEAHLSKVRGVAVKLTKAQIAGIDKRLNQAARDIRARDPAKWATMTPEERTVAMGIESARELEKAADETLKAKLIQTQKRIDAFNEIKQMAATPIKEGGTLSNKKAYQYPHVQGVIRMLQQVDRQKGGRVAATFGKLTDLISAMNVKYVRWPSLSSQEGEQMMGLVFREMRGEATNSPEAKAFAQSLTEMMAAQRDELNSYGANIRELKNYVPQDHNGRLINKAGKDKWTSDLMQWIDKSDFLDADGNQLDDAGIRDTLGQMWETIKTDGRAKLELNDTLAQLEGRLGSRSVMERASSYSRKINFKASASHEAYHALYSELSPTGLLTQHLTHTAEDLAVISRFGPDAKQNILKLTDAAHVLDDAHADAYRQRTGKSVSKERAKRTVAGLTPEQLTVAVLGRDTDYQSLTVDASRWLSAMHSGTKLTRTALRAVPQDSWTIVRYLTELGQLSRLPQLVSATMDGAKRRDLQMMGIGTQVLEQAAHRVGRNTVALARESKLKGANTESVSRMSAAVARLTGLQQWTNNAGRVGQLAHGVHIMDSIGKDWAKLDNGSKQMFAEAGINENNWPLIQRAKAYDVGNGIKIPDMRPETLAATFGDPAEHNEAARLLQAYIWEGHNKITNEKDVLARNAGLAGAEPGTTAHAVIQQLMMFKGVVSVVMANKIRMYRRYEGWGLAGVIAADIVGASFAGILGNTAVNAMDGKKTDWANPSQMFKGFATGGGAAFAGDLISFGVDQIGSNGQSTSGVNVGPSGSELIDIFGIGRQAFKDMDNGEGYSKTGYKALQFGRNHIPLMNLWYTKAAFDHLFMNDMNEQLNPGYQQKLIDRNEQAGQGYFFPPDKNAF